MIISGASIYFSSMVCLGYTVKNRISIKVGERKIRKKKKKDKEKNKEKRTQR